MTIGEDRVRVKFNVTGDSGIDDIKRRTAELIDICESMKNPGKPDEKNRLCAKAQTSYEEAAMWAVKAFTA